MGENALVPAKTAAWSKCTRNCILVFHCGWVFVILKKIRLTERKSSSAMVTIPHLHRKISRRLALREKNGWGICPGFFGIKG
jgi:hypothetical protein